MVRSLVTGTVLLLLLAAPMAAASIYNTGLISITISDTAPATSTLTVPDSFFIADVNVTINLTHTFVGDLDLSLESPLGTTVILSENVGGAGNDYANTVFDDEAGTPIGSGTPPFAGTFRPVGFLSGFDGEDASGDWTLTILDDFGGDNGELKGWGLELESRKGGQIPEPSTLALMGLGLGVLVLRRRLASRS